jgi:hypothetical protein
MNFFRHLCEAIRENDLRYFPSMRILVVDANASEIRCLIGEMCWDGTIPRAPEEVISEAFGSLPEFIISQTIHTAWEYEGEVCRLYGLSYRLTEVIERAGNSREFQELVVGAESCEWVPVDGVDDSFDDFLVSSAEHFEALSRWFARVAPPKDLETTG